MSGPEPAAAGEGRGLSLTMPRGAEPEHLLHSEAAGHRRGAEPGSPTLRNLQAKAEGRSRGPIPPQGPELAAAKGQSLGRLLFSFQNLKAGHDRGAGPGIYPAPRAGPGG